MGILKIFSLNQWNLMAIIALLGIIATLSAGLLQVLVQAWLRRRRQHVLEKEFGADFYSKDVYSHLKS